MRHLLWPFGILYAGITSLRNYFYDKGWLKTFAFDFPVILVGNLSTGGTGKTPHVEYIIRLLQSKYRVSVLSRGYKRALKGYAMATELSLVEDIGDEPKQIKQKFPDVEVAVSEDRVRGVYYILQDAPDTGVIVLDDGMQHRRITASLNILLTTYAKPYYKDHILPVGNLRETRKGADRARVIVVTKCPPQISDAEKTQIIRSIAPAAHQQVFFSCERYGDLYPLFAEQEITEMQKASAATLVSGIAAQESFTQAARTSHEIQGSMGLRSSLFHQRGICKNVSAGPHPMELFVLPQRKMPCG
ncbi:MAG: tetraacyldisaccharide 4'-kinase [Chitinophagales bacterium]